MYTLFNYFLVIFSSLSTQLRGVYQQSCHNRISLDIASMAHANFPRYSWEMNLSALEQQALLGLMSDSYLTSPRLFGPMILSNANRPKKLVLYPHEIELTENSRETQHVATIDNYSFGGAKMSTTQRRENILHPWADHIPRCTIIHLGACDLANGPQGRHPQPRQAFPQFTMEFLHDLVEAARIRATDQEKFQRDISQHIFLLIGIPRWGEFEVEKRGSLGWIDLNNVTRPANQGLNRNRATLWTNHRAILFTPRLSHPGREMTREGQGVHLDRATQESYNMQIFSVAAKVRCSHCRLSDEFNREEHKNIADGLCKNPAYPPQ